MQKNLSQDLGCLFLVQRFAFGAATWITFFFGSGIDDALKKDGTFANKLQEFLKIWLVGLFILGLIALVAINSDGTPSEYKQCCSQQ